MTEAETITPSDKRYGFTRADASALLKQRLISRTARVVVMGLGYVGMPAARAIAQAGFKTVGYDPDPDAVRAARSEAERVVIQGPGGLDVSCEPSVINDADVILICVPTENNQDGSTDLDAVMDAAATAAQQANQPALISLESTVAPGCTREAVTNRLQALGRPAETDFVVHAPEREDPGKTERTVGRIPRVVGADDDAARDVGAGFYEIIAPEVITTSSTEAAETAKLTENAFRAVNIAFANEVKRTCQALSIDHQEVIGAAASKPFGFMRFDPGPGVGGHCVPVDPEFMVRTAQKAGEPLGVLPKAVQANAAEPGEVAERALDGLDRQRGKIVVNPSVLVIGAAYKKNVADTRHSPAIGIMNRLADHGSNVTFHDPYVDKVTLRSTGRELVSVPLTADRLRGTDLVIIATDHDDVDWSLIAAQAPVIADARGIFRTDTGKTFRV